MLFKGTDKPGPVSKEFLNPDFKTVIASPDCQRALHGRHAFMEVLKCFSINVDQPLLPLHEVPGTLKIVANKLPTQFTAKS